MIRKAWTDACEAAGIPDFHIHDLRHVGMTEAARVPGITVKDLMVRLGHRTPVAALRYLHSAQERQDEVAALIDAALDAARG